MKKLGSSCNLGGGGPELGIPKPRSEALPALIVLVTLDNSLNLPEFQCPHLWNEDSCSHDTVKTTRQLCGKLCIVVVQQNLNVTGHALRTHPGVKDIQASLGNSADLPPVPTQTKALSESGAQLTLCSNPNNGSCPWYKTNIVSYLPTLTVCQASVLSGLCCVNSSNLPSNPRRELKYIPTLQMRSLRFKEPVFRPHVLSQHAVLTLSYQSGASHKCRKENNAGGGGCHIKGHICSCVCVGSFPHLPYASDLYFSFALAILNSFEFDE